MPGGCRTQCKEGFFSPHGLFDCKGDSLLLQAVPNVRGHRPEPEAGMGRSAARGIGAGEGGSALPGVTLETPVCRARGGEQSRSGAGSRCTGGQGAGPEPSGQSWPNRPGRDTQVAAPSPRVPWGRGAPNESVSRTCLSRDAEDEGCARGHRHWVVLP